MGFIDGLKRLLAGGGAEVRPPWDPVDIQACLSRNHDVCQEYLKSGPESEARRNELRAGFLSAESRPSLHDHVFFIPTWGRNRMLTAQNEDGDRCGLLFTSPGRAMFYGAVNGDQGECKAALGFRLIDGRELAESFEAASIDKVTLDKCPFCWVFASFDPLELRDADSALSIWAIFRTTNQLYYETFFKAAEDKFSVGEVAAARAIGEHILTHVDADRPDVHLLLGQCGVLQGDRDMIGRKVSVLRGYGDRWVERLAEFETRTG
ncbi:MAG: hypothetical protein OEN01_12445 [Candidatus Krumholzibacteria bacterium]|nr:hypothetical protein [Candidatus Krumholzibacteria bacterium]